MPLLQPRASDPRTAFRQLLASPGIIRSLGAHDVFTALLVEQAGFETVFVGGFGTSASLLGLPDVNFLTLSEMADQVRRMARRLSVPLIADGDTGHGDVHNVVRTVREFEDAGAAGILLEDQVMPKRCGHFEGKRLIPTDEHVRKLRAAIAARDSDDFIIIARTDARAVTGLDDAIQRVQRYGDAGADVVFIEAPHSVAELERIAREVDYPLFVNMLTFGRTPILSVRELEQMGYKITVCPIASLLITAHAIRRLAHALLGDGRVDGLSDEMLTFDEVKDVLGLDEVLSWGDAQE